MMVALGHSDRLHNLNLRNEGEKLGAIVDYRLLVSPESESPRARSSNYGFL